MDRPTPRATLETTPYRIRRSYFDHIDGCVYSRLSDIPRRLRPSASAVRAFLRIGYVPGNATLFEGVDCLPGGATIEVSCGAWKVVGRQEIPKTRLHAGWNEELTRGADVFVRCVERCLRRTSNPLVPLSGGMDSRAILAALMEMISPWKIETYTHGTQGANDFEIGGRVAREAGTRHTTIDLDSVPFDEARLRQTAEWSDANTDLAQPAVWCRIAEIFGESPAHWTGFTGDGLGGSFAALSGPSDADGAVREYVKGESIRGLWFDSPISELDTELVERNGSFSKALPPLESVWFANHVERYTAHHIFMNRLQYENPYMDSEFVGFMLNLPPRWRLGKRFFNEMMRRRFPRLFELPTKDYGWQLSRHPGRQLFWKAEQGARKMLWRITRGQIHHPMMSYLDFGHALRTQKAMRRLAEEFVGSLAGRGILDGARAKAMWRQHMTGTADHRYLITLLMSLETSLRVFCD